MEKKQHKSDKHHRHHHHPHPQQSSSSSSSGGESGGSSPAHGAPKAANAFANDGSFMELFKKKMEDEERRKREGEEEETKSSAAAPDKKPLSVSSFVRTAEDALYISVTHTHIEREGCLSVDSGHCRFLKPV